MEITYLTQEGLNKLKAELTDLKTRGRSEIAQQIAEAREKGDLSENAEYESAKDAQGLLELEISKLETILANTRIIDTSHMEDGIVYILSKVTIKNKKNNATVNYTLVAEQEANLKEGKISVKSPVGSALLGKKIGDIVDVNVPAGLIQFEILDITR